MQTQSKITYTLGAAMLVTCTKKFHLAAFALALLAPTFGFAADPVAKTDGETAGLRIEVVELKRGSGDTLTVRFNLINDSGEKFEPKGWYFGDYKGHQNQDIGSVGALTLIDTVGKKKYFVVRDTDENCVCSNPIPSVNAKSRAALWAKFPAPPSDVKKIGVVIPHFIPMDDVPISQ